MPIQAVCSSQASGILRRHAPRLGASASYPAIRSVDDGEGEMAELEGAVADRLPDAAVGGVHRPGVVGAAFVANAAADLALDGMRGLLAAEVSKFAFGVTCQKKWPSSCQIRWPGKAMRACVLASCDRGGGRVARLAM